MVIYGPGFTGGKVIDKLVSLIDLPPTILAAAGLEKPETMRGQPLQKLIDGTADDWQDDIFLQISESHCGRAIRTQKWKYSVRAPGKTGSDPDSDVYVEDFLYDLLHDPHERSNLVADPAYLDVCVELASRLKYRMKQAGEEIPDIIPAK